MSETKAVVETRVVHDVHRMATTLLADAAGRASADLSAVDELRTFLVKNLHHHHETEDHILWPLIEQAAPGVSTPLAELSEEHETLDRVLDELEAAPLDGAELATAAQALRDIVHRHLEHEEPILFPALRAHVTEQAWDEFSAQVMATAPPEAAHLAIGFFDRVATPAEVEMLLAGLPEPVRGLVPMMRKQAEEAFAALGAA
ncbi:hemerythrin domain-containing protein [Micromonospora sp. GCM10011542]|uniref:hemerythrin domain-containing protein n=1 Tax=Micromonospora sp. GCM10011542 TaxID=3317337 RepID=UPI00361828D7